MSLKRRSVIAAVLAAAAMTAASACLIVLDDLSSDPYGTRQELHRVVPFKPGGTLALRNLDGGIEVRGWDREEIELTVESEARGQVRRGWQLARSFGRPRFDVETTGERLVVRTRWEGDDRDVYPVHYFLSVPRSIVLEEVATQRGDILVADLYGRAKLKILDGDLTVENYSGGLEAEVIRGSIRAEVLDLRPADAVRLTVGTGDIRLALEPTASARVQAEASAGVGGEWPVPGTGRSADFKIGAGDAAITLKSASGRVEVVKIK